MTVLAPLQDTPTANITARGVYVCAACGSALFSSVHGVATNTLTFAFDRELHEGAVRYHSMHDHGLDRIDVHCGSCDAHVGNVFVNEPTPTGKRFCLLKQKVVFTPVYD